MDDHYVIEVALKDVKPRIWRRFMITTEATFIDLHEAIQDACGWMNSHLFEFRDEKGNVVAHLPGRPVDAVEIDEVGIEFLPGSQVEMVGNKERQEAKMLPGAPTFLGLLPCVAAALSRV
jgi:hypothetical protein